MECADTTTKEIGQEQKDIGECRKRGNGNGKHHEQSISISSCQQQQIPCLNSIRVLIIVCKLTLHLTFAS